MKFILVFISLLSINSLLAYTMETSWSNDGKKRIKIACEAQESLCDQICGTNQCLRVEKPCVDCIGSSLKIDHILEEMGRTFTRREQKVEFYALVDYLTNYRLISLTSKTIYNLIDRFDSEVLRKRFQSVCSDGTQYPIVFFSRSESGRPNKVKFVWCSSGTFEMKDSVDPLIM